MSVDIIGDKCIGCTFCSNICPTKAISISYNETLEEYAIVDNKKCIQCLVCESMCPVFNVLDKENLNQIIGAYSAYAKQEYAKSSSSGATFYSIAKTVLNKGWYVCGAVYTDHYRSVKHLLSSNIKEVMLMRGSKYVQSSMRDLYNQLNDALHNTEKKILFSGTPCQCAAIKSYFSKYLKRIYLIDLVCNGHMPPIMLQKDIDDLIKDNGSTIEFYTMRYKNGSYLPIFKKVDLQNGNVIVEEFYKSDIGAIYGSRICLRKSCYSCQFKGINRVGDITIGDYRGFRIEDMNDHPVFGESMVLVNNEKGVELIRILKDVDGVVIRKAISLKEVLITNNRLIIQGFAPFRKSRVEFLKSIKNNNIKDLRKIINKYYMRKYVILRKIYEKFQVRKALKENEF